MYNIHGAIIALMLCLSGATAYASNDISIAEELKFHSNILDEDRSIVISLPDGYEDSTARYPVLYVLDGAQNLLHVVGSVEVLTRTGGIPPVIIVGIVGENRARDYTPSAIEGSLGSGGGKNFLNFMASELVPYIEANYRTHPFRVLEGHSLGGLFAVYALMEKTDLFDAHIVMSPALWWNKEEMTARAKHFFKEKGLLNKSVYLSIGSEDGYGMRQELKRFVEAIEEAKPKGLIWRYQEADGEGHMSAPLLINYYGLKHVFSDLKIPDNLRTSFDKSKFAAHEAGIRKKYGASAKQSSGLYAGLGFELMEQARYEDATAVFGRLVEAYPEYHAYYAWLGKAYEKNGEYEAALKSYKIAAERTDSRSIALENYQSEIDRLQKIVSKAD